MKVAINACHGGFGLSVKAVDLYAEKSGFKVFHYFTDYSGSYSYKNRKTVRYIEEEADRVTLSIYHLREDIGDEPTEEVLNAAEWFYDDNIERDDPILIEVIEELGDEANGSCAQLKIVEIPDGTEYCIEEYAGAEHIAEVHQTWY